jgi:hypothetical protein
LCTLLGLEQQRIVIAKTIDDLWWCFGASSLNLGVDSRRLTTHSTGFAMS